MKKNGFVFVETIIAIVVLTSSLLLLYSTFNKVLQSEKTRVYYDDIAYIYRSYYLKKRISKLNMNTILNDITNNNDKYFVTVGMEYQDLFKGYEKERTYFSNMLQDFDVNQIIVLKENKLNDLKSCTLECGLNPENCNVESQNKTVISNQCNAIYTNLSDEFISYLKSIYVDVSCTYIMAIEYNICTGSNGFDNCKRYYSWVSV